MGLVGLKYWTDQRNVRFYYIRSHSGYGPRSVDKTGTHCTKELQSNE